jgi:hypothetical protein
MERKDFLLKSALLEAWACLLIAYPAMHQHRKTTIPSNQYCWNHCHHWKHNGGLNIRTRIRSAMTNAVYSNVECAVAPKTMGPPPHFHKELDETDVCYRRNCQCAGRRHRC